MTAVQMGLTIAVCTAATMLTRFLPFLIFSSKEQQPPEVVRYLGRVLPAAIFGMLIVYCLKSVTPFAGSRGAPEAIALLVTVALHKWKHETLLSVAGGTLCYVLLASSHMLLVTTASMVMSWASRKRNRFFTRLPTSYTPTSLPS